MLYCKMNFVSVDEDVADNLYHCCCNVDDDLVCEDDDRTCLYFCFFN